MRQSRGPRCHALPVQLILRSNLLKVPVTPLGSFVCNGGRVDLSRPGGRDVDVALAPEHHAMCVFDDESLYHGRPSMRDARAPRRRACFSDPSVQKMMWTQRKKDLSALSSPSAAEVVIVLGSPIELDDGIVTS